MCSSSVRNISVCARVDLFVCVCAVLSPRVNYAEEIRYRPEDFKVTKREMIEFVFGDKFQVVLIF